MEPVKTVEYKNHTIKVFQDFDAPNPWTDWDTEPPIIFTSNQGLIDYGDVANTIIEALLNMDDQANIAGLLGLAGYLAEDTDDMAGMVIDEIVDRWEMDQDLDFLEEIADFAGIPCKTGTVTIYHNGQGINYLIALTPAWYKLTGAPAENSDKDLELTAQLFYQWINGEVYGYNIEGPLCDDSCWGFYGEPDVSGGMVDEAKRSIDYAIDKHNKQHQTRVKQLIKNHVPLEYRTAEAV